MSNEAVVTPQATGMITTKHLTASPEKQMIAVIMRAKAGAVWVKSVEEQRINGAISHLAYQMTYKFYTWKVTTGLSEFSKKDAAVDEESKDLATALRKFLKISGRAILLALDPAPWLRDPTTMRVLKDTHQRISSIPDKMNAKQVVLLDTRDCPESIPGMTTIDWSLPSRETLTALLNEYIGFADEDAKEEIKTNGNFDNVVSTLMGMNISDAANSLSISLASKGRFDIPLIANEKRRIVRGSGLEWYDPDPRGMDGIGGNANLKAWLMERLRAFSPEAREYGLPIPKGCMIMGIPGTGKSLTSKCMASAWRMPLLRMDVGALFSKYVGESEEKIRLALKTAEAVAPAILWIDEIEKAFPNQGGEGDGGTSSRVFGTFLTWLQEKKEGVFVIATSNDISKLPAEFLRAGRWDEIWFVDLPNQYERKEISEVMKRKFKNCQEVSSEEIALASEDNTGAELEQAYADGMYKAFGRGESVKTEDVLQSLSERVPLVKTMNEKITKLREWSKGRARVASMPMEGSENSGQRKIETEERGGEGTMSDW